MSQRQDDGTRSFSVRGVPGIPEVEPGTDLAALIAGTADDLRDGDIVVVTSKIVSKAEGRVVRGRPAGRHRRRNRAGGRAAR